MSREPWWASGADDLRPGEDPLAQHARARSEGAAQRGGPADDVDWDLHDRAAWSGAGDAPPGARSAFEDAVDGLGALARAARSARDGRRGGQAHREDVCRGCPWCTFLRAVGDGRPEVVAHFAEAVRHLTLAARAMVDAADAGTEYEPIPLDEDPS